MRSTGLDSRAKTFLIVGGGASGVLMAVQLLRHSPSSKVKLFEKRPEIGAGIAYGTEHPHHLLNVRARGMSAFPDEPDHFLEWISPRPKWRPADGWSANSFVPRRLYRDYLAGLAEPFLEGLEAKPRLEIVHREVVRLAENGDGAMATTSDGVGHAGDFAILATGNEGPGLPPADRRYDCWTSRAGFDIPAEASVAIVGTGLSMVDSVISLLDAGHSGSLVAISRRGLLPQPQAGTDAAAMDRSEIPFGVRLSKLAHWLRARVRRKEREEQLDWRCVVDGLRPYSQEIWAGLSQADKRRFLRHARPWWDIHRHRMAPQIRARIDGAVASGQLSVMSGRISELRCLPDCISIKVTPRAKPGEIAFEPDYLIECRGQNTDIAATHNPALASLLSQGSVRADPFKLGVDVSPHGAVLDRQGRVSDRIFAIGPVTCGTFWEIVAVPDIRLQAKNLARRLTGPQVPSTSP